MRQYEPIWERIKRDNTASLVAPVENHKRIIKAVIKEKYKDEGYKLLLSNKCLQAKLIITYHIEDPKMISFSLQTSIADKYIGVNDL